MGPLEVYWCGAASCCCLSRGCHGTAREVYWWSWAPDRGATVGTACAAASRTDLEARMLHRVYIRKDVENRCYGKLRAAWAGERLRWAAELAAAMREG